MSTIPSGRVDDQLFDRSETHWSDVIAERVLQSFPHEELYTCAAGISPSGIVHFGNFRDVMTSVGVAHALKARGKNVRVLFSWDNYDRFRKVPAGVDLAWIEHIGKPLTAVPDPSGKFSSYAERFQVEFEASMKDLGIDLVYRYQTDEYTQGHYVDRVIHAMKNRRRIGEILFENMSEIGIEKKQLDREEYLNEYYPIAVYSRFTGKDSTKVLSYDGEHTIVYRCLDTNQEETLDLTKDFCVKLAWKADWSMRWGVEKVHFEPGGKDHASPGSSFDVGALVAREIFAIEPPVFTGYEFVGVQGLGGKMSGSKGNAISPAQLLEIYEPALLKWLYTRKQPRQAFTLAFDTELYRQYDEYDRACGAMHAGTLPPHEVRALQIAQDGSFGVEEPIAFKQAVALGQILQWDQKKVFEISRSVGYVYAPDSLVRLLKARAWLETYNPGEVIKLLPEVNTAYRTTLSEESSAHIDALREYLVVNPDAPIADIEVRVYDIPKKPELSQKENSVLQRTFFKHVYQLLIGSDTGPRLSTFLWAADRKRVLELLAK
jgi:lysyl-tRNA synthetase, class I